MLRTLCLLIVVSALAGAAGTGNPPSEWDITGAGDSSIQGFTTDISINTGETVSFKIKTTGTAYVLDIYRMGYYGGDGAIKVATVTPTATQIQASRNQPACLTNSATGLIDCGNWGISATWTATAAKSGIYFAKATNTSNGGASHIVFVVRNDASHSEILFQTSDTTWQAYNQYGGNSLYVGSPAGRAYKVSYNRPMTTRGTSPEDWVFNAEYPMVRWLEANGYDVTYTTGVDTDRRGDLIRNHKVFMSVGHDEYWSGNQRAKVEAARGAGVHLMFLSGNEVFWKTRWENSIDSSNAQYRTLVCYKETHAGAKIDPNPAWTGTWRDPRFSPPADGNRPENELTGTIFTVNCCPSNAAVKVPAAEGKMRFWRNTSVANLSAGQTATFSTAILNYEWDEDLNNGFRPPGLMRLSNSTVSGVSYLQDHGSTYGSGTATHSFTLYRHASGALVFGAGTPQYSWGLDDDHDRPAAAADVRLQQATVNLLADMDVQPATLQPGLLLALSSTDTSPPITTITSPAAGSVIPVAATTISGTAFDTGGQVASVEVSVDGGTTWRVANGRATWSYNWSPAVSGPTTIMSRGIDDTGNVQSPPTSITVTVGSGSPTCPCSIWDSTTVPGNIQDPDTASVELGMKFRSDVAGSIAGIRFYKGPNNTGTHVGALWTSSGTLLATATFSNETASGWQQALFAAPVAITANTTYIASYHAPVGRYSSQANFFAAGVDRPPLHALASGVDGGNGIYAYGATTLFPSNTYNNENYWVDVVFLTAGPDTTAPVVSAVTANPGSTTATVSWTTNENSTSRVDYGTSSSSLSLNAVNATPKTAHSITLTGLTPGTTYFYRVTSADAANNSTTAPAVNLAPATFSTTAPDTAAPLISSVAASPGSNTALISWTTNEPANSRVDFGLSAGSLTSTATDPSLVLSHTITLTGLTPGTPYFYRVSSADASGNSSTSPAAPASPATFTTGTSTAVLSSMFGNTAPGTAEDTDTAAVELGMKFRSDVAGTVTGIRFYKGPNNTGTHVGNLWTSTGTRLATVTFVNETASGWQQANLASPVNINPGTTYIVSYHAPFGRYAADGAYFATSGNYTAPLYALRTGIDGVNGLYIYGSGGFPTQSFNATNYWVDVMFSAPSTSSVRLFPATKTVETGTAAAGSVTSLNIDDNSFATLNSTTSGTRTTSWYGGFTAVPNAINSLTVSYVGKNSRSCTETIFLYNWSTSTWVQLSSNAVGTGELLRANLAPGTGLPTDYVSGTSGTGEVRARVRCTASANFTTSAELMSISYAP